MTIGPRAPAAPPPGPSAPAAGGLTTRRAVLILLGLAALLLILPAGVGALYNETDGQYAGAARRMVQGGSWLIPENNGVPRLVKPPLLYWMMAGSFRVFGVNEFAARLPGALGLTAAALLVFALAARFGGPRRGLLAGVVFLTSLGVATLGRIVMPEPVFVAFIVGAIYAGLLAMEAPDRRAARGWAILFWVACGLACLTKGPHGLAYPLAILLLSGAGVPAWRPGLVRLASVGGVLAFLAINLPWYFYVESRFPGWLSNLVQAEHGGHLLGNGAPATRHGDVPRGQFLALHLAWLFPWSIVGLLALRRGLHVGRPLAVLLGVWIAVVVLPLLLLGERQDYYAMAAWPAVAVLVAVVLDGARLRAPVAVLGTLCAVGALACAGFLGAPPEATGSAALAARDTAWTTVTGFGPEVWLGVARLGLGVFLAGLAVAVVGWIRPRRAVAACAAVAAVFSLGAILGYALVAPYFSLAPAAAALKRLPPGAPIGFEGGIDTASSLLVYADQPVLLIGGNPAEDFVTRTTGIGRERLITPEKFAVLWRSGVPMGFVVERSERERWEALLGALPEPDVVCGTQLVYVRAP